MADIRGERFEQAYNRMSPSYRANNDLSTFTRAVREMEALTAHTASTVTMFRYESLEHPTAPLGGMLQTPNGTIQFNIRLVKPGETWFIEALSVGGVDLGS